MRDGGVRRLRGDPRALRRLGRLGRAASFRRAGIDRLGRERRRRRHRAPTSLSQVETNRRCPPSSSSAPNAPASSSASSISSAVAPPRPPTRSPTSPSAVAPSPPPPSLAPPVRLCSRRRAFPLRVEPSPRRRRRVRPRVFARTPTRLPSPVARRWRGVGVQRAPHRLPRRGSKTTSSSGNPRDEGDRLVLRSDASPVVTRTRAVRVSPVGFESHRPVQAADGASGDCNSPAASTHRFLRRSSSRFSVAAIRRAATRRRSARRIAATTRRVTLRNARWRATRPSRAYAPSPPPGRGPGTAARSSPLLTRPRRRVDGRVWRRRAIRDRSPVVPFARDGRHRVELRGDLVGIHGDGLRLGGGRRRTLSAWLSRRPRRVRDSRALRRAGALDVREGTPSRSPRGSRPASIERRRETLDRS